MSTDSAVPAPDDASAWLTVSQLAERIGEDTRKVRQLVRQQRLFTVNRRGTEVVPAAFVAEGQLLKGLGGLTTVLRDAGFDAEQSVRWMFSAEATLGMSPLQAMAAGRSTEVKRLAQTLAL